MLPSVSVFNYLLNYKLVKIPTWRLLSEFSKRSTTLYDIWSCEMCRPSLNQYKIFTVNQVYFSILWGYHRFGKWAYCERRRCLTCSYSSYSGASLDFSAARTWNVVKLSNIWRITGSLSDISNHILPINISHPSIHIYYNLFSKQYNTHSNVVAFLQGFLSIILSSLSGKYWF